MKPYLYRTSVLAFALFLLAALSPAAAGQGPRRYDALKRLEAKADEVVDVTLDGDSLRFAGAVSVRNDPEKSRSAS